MMPKLTRYSSFKELKADVHTSSASKNEVEHIHEEYKELMQLLRNAYLEQKEAKTQKANNVN